MDIDGLRTLIAQHANATNALVGLGMAMKAKVSGVPLAGETATRVAEIVDHLGAGAVIEQPDPTLLLPLLAGIRADIYLGAKVLAEGLPPAGWEHSEPALLQSFGDVSSGFPSLLAHRMLRHLPGLEAALEAPGAAFLDVGVGVGALSIAMLARWPGLRAVGIDPLDAALELARAKARAFGLEDRLELRAGLGGDLKDRDVFDPAFVPSAFIPKAQLGTVARQVAAALKPGGWVLVAMVNPGTETLQAKLAKFRTALWGGTVSDESELRHLLGLAGLTDCSVLPGPAASPIAFIVGRRPAEAAFEGAAE